MKSILLVFNIALFGFGVSTGYSQTITIFPSESAEFVPSNDCCVPSILSNNNASFLNYSHCWDDYVYGCVIQKNTVVLTFDLSGITETNEIQSWSFNLTIHNPDDPIMIISSTESSQNLTISIGNELWGGGDWSYSGSWSTLGVNDDYSSNIEIMLPMEELGMPLVTGQLNVMFTDNGQGNINIYNTGDQAPQLIVSYGSSPVPPSLIQPANNEVIEFSNMDLNNLVYFEWAEASNFGDTDYYLEFDSYLSAVPVTMINNTTASVSYESIQSIMDSLNIDWLAGNWDVLAVSDGDTMSSENGPFYVMFNSVELGTVSGLMPAQSKLYPAFPNPFNPTTTIRFNIDVGDALLAHPALTIFDIAGRVVDVLVSGEMVVGEHTIQWDASAHPSGVYLTVLETGTTRQTQKLILLK